VTQAQELEQAILARAERLAAEYRERAKRSRDTILRDAAEKLRLREQREEAIAKSLGERTYRQQVQAEELKMQSHLDRVRWNLVRDVEARLTERIETLTRDEDAWRETLAGLIVTAAAQIERDTLTVRANARDHKLLSKHWTALTETLPDGKQVRLQEDPIDTIGGVLVVADDGRIRVDNTVEGRMARLRAQLQQRILERLLPSGFDTGNIFGG
jgi:V/A-type H+-transporting ATPase subunit E